LESSNLRTTGERFFEQLWAQGGDKKDREKPLKIHKEIQQL
jgi:hypothetical protein